MFSPARHLRTPRVSVPAPLLAQPPTFAPQAAAADELRQKRAALDAAAAPAKKKQKGGKGGSQGDRETVPGKPWLLKGKRHM